MPLEAAVETSRVESVVMAKVPVEETSGSGTDTLEYKCLLKNQGDIVMTLKSLKAAKCKLILKYQEKELIPLTESPTEEQLLVQALDRVRTKATEFRVFVEMLEDIKGLDLIVEKLQIQGIANSKCSFLNLLRVSGW